MPEVEFICLANSRRPGGRCVAGLRMDGHGWIRPVNPLTGSGISGLLDDEKEVALLDVVQVSLKQPCPKSYQPENWVLDDKPWRLVRRLSPAEAGTHLATAIDSRPDFLVRGIHNKIHLSDLDENPVAASLTLVEPEEVSWNVKMNYKYQNEKKYSAYFALAGRGYDLPITDPIWKSHLAALPLGLHERHVVGIGKSKRILFTISLGEPFPRDRYCYKLIAAVIVLPR